jgi:hypothetical protein
MRKTNYIKNKLLFKIALLALLSKEMYCEDMNIDHKIQSNQEGIFNKM